MKMHFNAGMVYAGQLVEIWTHELGYISFLAHQDGLQPLSQDVYRVRVNGELRVELEASESAIGPLNG